MIGLRQIQTVQGNVITIQLPEEFCAYQQVEVIVLPIENSTITQTNTEQFIHRFAGSIPDFPEIESEGFPEEREHF